jgi:hypothetical protein
MIRQRFGLKIGIDVEMNEKTYCSTMGAVSEVKDQI